MLRALRWQAELLARLLGPPARRAVLGTLMIDVSLLFALYAPFSGEKPGVYWMSQLALLFGGVIAVLEAVAAMRREDE